MLKLLSSTISTRSCFWALPSVSWLVCCGSDWSPDNLEVRLFNEM